MRYIKQRERFTCTPVAVVNALKHLGYRQTYDDVQFWRQALLTESVNGTFRRELSRTFEQLSRLMNLFIVEHQFPTIQAIERSLDAGCAVIVCAKIDKTIGHAFLISGQTRSSFVLVNCGHSNNRVIRKRAFGRQYRRRVAWFIKRGDSQ